MGVVAIEYITWCADAVTAHALRMYYMCHIRFNPAASDKELNNMKANRGICARGECVYIRIKVSATLSTARHTQRQRNQIRERRGLI